MHLHNGGGGGGGGTLDRLVASDPRLSPQNREESPGSLFKTGRREPGNEAAWIACHMVTCTGDLSPGHDSCQEHLTTVTSIQNQHVPWILSHFLEPSLLSPSDL